MGSQDPGVGSYGLQWNEFLDNNVMSFLEFKRKKKFTDVNLVVGDDMGNGVKVISAHKVVLAALSPFFDQLFSGSLSQVSNPMIYLRGIRVRDMENILTFAYQGKVQISQEDLNTFCAVAQDLKIKGLTDKEQETPKPTTSGVQRNRSDGGQMEKRSEGYRPPQKRKKQFATPRPHCSQQPQVDPEEVEEVKCEEDFAYEGQIGDVKEEYLSEFQNEEFSQSGTSDGDGITSHVREIMKQNTTQVENGILCLICGKVLTTDSGIRIHFRDAHSGATEKFSCPVCKSIYKNRNSFRKHISVYHKELRGLDIKTCLVQDDDQDHQIE